MQVNPSNFRKQVQREPQRYLSKDSTSYTVSVASPFKCKTELTRFTCCYNFYSPIQLSVGDLHRQFPGPPTHYSPTPLAEMYPLKEPSISLLPL